MDGFSGVLKLVDLDDYIAPSQECVKPIELPKESNDKVNIQGKNAVRKVTKITLNDCLACSGCITSAEAVLVTQQSDEELISLLEKKKVGCGDVPVLALSLSPQSCASLAAEHNLTMDECLKKVTGAVKQLGMDFVFDITQVRDFSLVESALEFVERFKNKTHLPLLTSACPGWICYAEKTHGSWILPYISRVRSPQQMMGKLMKEHLIKNGKVYHVTVMPCFDKKLEAYRNDFYNQETGIREVDCVLSTTQFDAFLSKLNLHLQSPISGEMPDSVTGGALKQFSSHQGTGAGGYVHFVATYAAKELFDLEMNTLEWTTLKNQDMRELVIKNPNDESQSLRFAIAYGFRNIQTVVQRMKRNRCQYDYIEIMACPSACTNGGGQIMSSGGDRFSSKVLLAKVDDLYHSLPTRRPLDGDDSALNDLYSQLSNAKEDYFFTKYHFVPKLNNQINVKW